MDKLGDTASSVANVTGVRGRLQLSQFHVIPADLSPSINSPRCTVGRAASCRAGYATPPVPLSVDKTSVVWSNARSYSNKSLWKNRVSVSPRRRSFTDEMINHENTQQIT